MENSSKLKLQMVDKEKIAELKFPSEEVLHDEQSKTERWESLQRATTLGNLDKIKFKIYFVDDEGQKYTETTIWGLTDKIVILKQGIMIPVHRILSIKF